MYKLMGQILVLIASIIIMVMSFPVNLSMVVSLLIGIIICTGAEVGILLSSEKNSDIDKVIHLADIIKAIYILAGIFVIPVFFLLPYVAMPIWKKYYKTSRIAAIIVITMTIMDDFHFIKIHDIDVSAQHYFIQILTLIVLSIIGIMLSYGAEMIDSYEMQLHQMRDESTEHDLLMEKVNNQLIETQNAKIYNATLKERNRIAREIHDNVGHMITRSILQVGAIGVINKDENLRVPIAELKETLDAAMGSMRKSVHDLYDESVDLKAALKQLEPLAKNFKYSLEYDCENEVQRDIKYAFIAIAKEAVNNAVKYSNGDQIKVVVREHPAFYQLQIIDNGYGADDKKLSGETGDGIGIKNMKERITSLGGTLQIQTNNGFMIFVTVMK